jgi:Mor family transcriptional regulator
MRRDAIDVNEPLPDVKWPVEMADMLAQMEDVFSRFGMADDVARRLAQETMLGLAAWRGGAMLYVPKAVSLRTALKHAEIWRYFRAQSGAVDMNDLAKRFDISVQTAYIIIKQQRKIHVAKCQRALF